MFARLTRVDFIEKETFQQRDENCRTLGICLCPNLYTQRQSNSYTAEHRQFCEMTPALAPPFPNDEFRMSELTVCSSHLLTIGS
jgi:hypothetical protein